MEVAGLEEMLACLPATTATSIRRLWDEYEHASTLEGRAAKGASLYIRVSCMHVIVHMTVGVSVRDSISTCMRVTVHMT